MVNVLGSRGSVVPFFERQIAEGGSCDCDLFSNDLLLHDHSRSELFSDIRRCPFAGGEVFILDMGKLVYIVELAKKMILLSGDTEEEIEIIEFGIRTGEKLYEELLNSSELVESQLNDRIFIGKVTDIPLEEIEAFVHSLNEKSQDEMKKLMIEFANMSAGKKENTVETLLTS